MKKYYSLAMLSFILMTTCGCENKTEQTINNDEFYRIFYNTSTTPDVEVTSGPSESLESNICPFCNIVIPFE